MDYTYLYTYRGGSSWRSYFSSKFICFHHPLYLLIFSLKVKAKIHFLMVLKAFHVLCHSWATQGVQNQVLHTLLKTLLTVTGHSCKASCWLFSGAHSEETENWFPMVPLIEMQTSPSGHQEVRAVLLCYSFCLSLDSYPTVTHWGICLVPQKSSTAFSLSAFDFERSDSQIG